jgi:hypothetical protein
MEIIDNQYATSLVGIIPNLVVQNLNCCRVVIIY